MAEKSEDNTETLIRDAMHLADSLDGMETRDWLERIGSAVERGNLKFAELQHRHQSLSVDAVDRATIDRILDTIRARLKFLESLHQRNRNTPDIAEKG